MRRRQPCCERRSITAIRGNCGKGPQIEFYTSHGQLFFNLIREGWLTIHRESAATRKGEPSLGW
jgi:hypothetical protein